MEIAIIAIGTRGDVQPCVALAKELQKEGIDVFVASHTEYKKLVVENNIKYYELPGNPATAWDKNPNKENTEKEKVNFSQQLENYSKGWLKIALEICKNSDAIVYTSLFFVGNHLAEKLNVPYFPIIFEPNLSTSAFPSAYFKSDKNFGGSFNKFTHKFAYQSFWLNTRKSVNRIRREVLDLSPSPFWGYFGKMQKEENPVFCSFSKHLIPKPIDWNKNINISGYWFLNKKNKYEPPKELVDFFSDGTLPIYFDFGSFSHDRMKRKVKIILEDLIKSNERLLIDPGKMDISDVKFSTEMQIIDNSVPHDWLLPKVKTIITHGGVGAVHAAMRAGVPTLPITIFPAQYFWGKITYKLGLGARPLTIKKLIPGQVLDSISYINNNHELKSNLIKIKNDLENENGPKTASDFIINYLE